MGRAHPDIDGADSVPVTGKPAPRTPVLPAVGPVACETHQTGLGREVLLNIFQLQSALNQCAARAISGKNGSSCADMKLFSQEDSLGARRGESLFSHAMIRDGSCFSKERIFDNKKSTNLALLKLLLRPS